MYFLNLFLVIFKGLFLFLNNFILVELSVFHLFCIIFFILYKNFLDSYYMRKRAYYQQIMRGTKEMLTEHILNYRFKNPLQIVISLYFVVLALGIYILGIFSIRIQNLKTMIDLNVIFGLFISQCKLMSLTTIILNLILIIIFFILLFQTLEIIKKYFLVLIIKLHCYFSVPDSYYKQKLDSLAFDTFLYKIGIFFDLLDYKIAYLLYNENRDLRDKFLHNFEIFFSLTAKSVKVILYYGHISYINLFDNL